MAAPRATKTTLAFGLVSIDVALYKTVGEAEKPPKWATAGPGRGEILPLEEKTPDTGTSSGGAPPASDPLASDPAEAFQQIADTGPDGDPEEQPVGREADGTLVFKDEVRRGIRKDDGSFADLTDGLEEIAERTKLEEMRIADFIRTEEVHRGRILGSYFLAPDGPGAPKVIRLLHEAMKLQKRVAVVKLTKRSKQALGVLIPDAQTGSLMLIECAWNEDMRPAPSKVTNVAEVEVDPTEVAITCELIQAMSSTRAMSLDEQEDDSRHLIRELVARVEAGEKFELPPRPEVEDGADVIQLMRRGIENRDELERSAA